MEVLSDFKEYPGSKVAGIFPDASGGYIIVSQNDGVYHLNTNPGSGEYKFSTIDTQK